MMRGWHTSAVLSSSALLGTSPFSVSQSESLEIRSSDGSRITGCESSRLELEGVKNCRIEWLFLSELSLAFFFGRASSSVSGSSGVAQKWAWPQNFFGLRHSPIQPTQRYNLSAITRLTSIFLKVSVCPGSPPIFTCTITGGFFYLLYYLFT